MSDHKQGIELSSLKAPGIPASDTQTAGLNQAPLIEVLVDDIEKTGGASHTRTPEIIVSAASPGPGLAADDTDKKPGFFGKFKQYLKVQLKKPVQFWNKTDKRTMLTASSCFLTVMMLCAMISLAVVAVHGSKAAPAMARAVELFHAPVPVMHQVTVQQRDHVSASLTGHDDNKIVSLTSTTGDTCDDETVGIVHSSAIAMTNAVNFNLSSTSASMMQSTSIVPVSVDVMTMSPPTMVTVTPFLTTSSMVPAAILSMSTSTPSSSVTETCLEYGDGAGPCARPYGRPNSTPESWMSSLAAESLGDASTRPVGASTSVLPIGIPAMASSNAFTTSYTDASLSSLMDAASIDASLCEPTKTVYVTLTASSEPNNGNPTILGGAGAGSGSTILATSTSLSFVTVTWSSSGGPLTTTETAFWNGSAAANSTTGQTVVAINGTGGLTTLHVPNYTLTLQTTVAPNRTAFSSADPTATSPYVASGGEQLTAPKPLGMGGSSSGNGVYCVVMLIALIAVLI